MSSENKAGNDQVLSLTGYQGNYNNTQIGANYSGIQQVPQNSISGLNADTLRGITADTNSTGLVHLSSYPYQLSSYPYQYYSYSYSEPYFLIKVEQAENGFIVHKGGQKFIVAKAEDILKYLKK